MIDSQAVMAVLQALSSNDVAKRADAPERSPYIGKYAVVRARDAGVHFGEVVWHEGRAVRLKRARRMWQWSVPMGKPVFLSGVAQYGIDHDKSKIGTPIDLDVLDACEIILATDQATQSIISAPEVNRTS